MQAVSHAKGETSPTTIVFFWIVIIILVLSGCRKNVAEVSEGIPDSVYLKKGDMIATATFDSLRKSLLRAIGAEGFDGAITFCNVNAFALTSTYADSVSIVRTALRYRNPENRPDSLEQVILSNMNSQLGRGIIPKPEVVRDDRTGTVHYFKPIMMQAMCLNCHGKPNDQINGKTMAKIEQLYPRDQAVNFKEGDLRGVWHISSSGRANR